VAIDPDGVPDLPWPPKDCGDLFLEPLATDQLPPELRAGQIWMRCADRRTPLANVYPRSRPRFRFDCPVRLDGSPRFQVWYGARTELGALCEVFIERKVREVSLPQRQSRHIGPVAWTRELRLLDLRAPRVVGVDERRDPGLDGGLANHHHYRLTRDWADAFHRCGDRLDGLLYVGRKSGDLAVALFEDRCGSALAAAGPALDLDDPVLDDVWQAFETLTRIRRRY
jgi:hypothetical protein